MQQGKLDAECGRVRQLAMFGGLMLCFLQVAFAEEPGEALLQAASKALREAQANDPRGRRGRQAPPPAGVKSVSASRGQASVEAQAPRHSSDSPASEMPEEASQSPQLRSAAAIEHSAAVNAAVIAPARHKTTISTTITPLVAFWPTSTTSTTSAPPAIRTTIAPPPASTPFVSSKPEFASEVQGATQRPMVGRILVQELFLGNDPISYGRGKLSSETFDAAMTHVNAKDIDMVLAYAPQPVTFWLELGAYEGGSAILTAQRARKRAEAASEESETTVVAVDTFLGDTRVLWERAPNERRTLLREDGTISLYERFRENVQRSGHADGVLPLPATSIVALRLFASLSSQGIVPAPQVVYLDSAHEEGEVFLELELAWKALAPGGIMFGDDWVLPPSMSDTADGRGDGNMVQRDVLRFAELHSGNLDDDFGAQVQPMRTLGRARPGLFVSYQSFQWFLRKRFDADKSKDTPPQASSRESSTPGGFDCWSDGFDRSDCCDEEKFGALGNVKCWDLVFTYEQCC